MKVKSFACGALCGAIIFGSIPAASAAISDLVVGESTQKIYVNGNLRDMQAYNINGSNFVKLRDIGQAADFGVTYDAATRSVHIDPAASYTPEHTSVAPPAQTVQSGTRVPNNGGARFVPKVGEKILCDDGTLYEIRDMTLYEKSGFTTDGKRFPNSLPSPTTDWSIYPEVKLPDVEVKHLAAYNSDGVYIDDLYILNLYEMRRIQYTLYNYIHPLAIDWYNARPNELKTVAYYGYDSSIEKNMGQIQFMDIPHPGAQGFYPWDENEVTKQVKNDPIARFCIEVWDVYHNGVYNRTEYKMQIISIVNTKL